MNDVQDGERGLALCPTHQAHMEYWFSDRLELATEHLWRLYIERGLALWRTMASPNVVGGMRRAFHWLRAHTVRNAGGCPVCFDIAPLTLLARLERATRETYLGTNAQWRVHGEQSIPALSGAGLEYFVRLEAIPAKAPQESAVGAWWN